MVLTACHVPLHLTFTPTPKDEASFSLEGSEEGCGQGLWLLAKQSFVAMHILTMAMCFTHQNLQSVRQCLTAVLHTVSVSAGAEQI